MTPHRSRGLAAAMACLGLGVLGPSPLLAQETAASSKPPANVVDKGSALFGRPEGEAAAKLAPVAGPPLATAAAKLPLDKLKVPDGFKIEVYASGLANARSMTQAPDGTLFVGTRAVGKVYAVLPNADAEGKRTVKTIATGLHRPNGVAYHDGALYVAELSKIWRFDDIAKHLDGQEKPKLVYDDLPKDEAHGWKFIAIGPDDKLYVPIGAPGNIVMPPETHAQIRRMDLDGKNVEVIARGVRNTVGFDWNPKDKQLWFTDNGRDWVSEDIPQDELNVVSTPGKEHFGYPYCHQGNFTDPEYGWGHSCTEFTAPVTLLGAHTAALGLRFYTGSTFPDAYKDGMFIARHGSWNRTHKLGGDVVAAKPGADGKIASVEPFLTGFIQDNKYVGRPADVLVAKDGSLLVSDDYNGAIYRISYAK